MTKKLKKVKVFHGGDLTLKITKRGSFSGFLFCSQEIATAASHGNGRVYVCEIQDLAVTDPHTWGYSDDLDIERALEKSVRHLKRFLDCDDDDADILVRDGDHQHLTEETVEKVHELEIEDPYFFQRWTCETARDADYAVVMMRDEHGISYAVDFFADGVFFEEKRKP